MVAGKLCDWNEQLKRHWHEFHWGSLVVKSEKAGWIFDAQIILRIKEEQPEIIVNYIECNLAFTDRSADKGHNDIMDIIKKKLISGFCWNLLKCSKGIGAHPLLIAYTMWSEQPFLDRTRRALSGSPNDRA